MKFCVDCKHHKQGYAELGYCTNPELGWNLVSGTNKVKLCSVVRYSGCGEDAKWFEPKQHKEKVKKGFVAWLTKLF